MKLKNKFICAWHEMAYHSRGPLRGFFLLWWPLMWFYSFAAKSRRQMYYQGWIQPKRLSIPVISVGNLTVGGVGKTPFVMYLAQWLQTKGWHPAVVMRGYFRKSKAPFLLDPANFEAENVYAYGDEPVLIMKTLDIPVGVGSDRYAIGKKLLQKEKCDVMVLDDGFQHYQLHRNCDFVMLDGENPLGSGHCLPYGPLREPASVLSYADALVFQGNRKTSKHDFTSYSLPMFEGEMMWKDILPLNAWLAGNIEETIPLHALQGREVDLLCGIGTPQRFAQQASAYGMRVRQCWIFPDHHWYTVNDLEQVQHSDFCLMTEKDAVRFYPIKNNMDVNHLFVVRAAWRMKEEKVFFEWLQEQLAL